MNSRKDEASEGHWEVCAVLGMGRGGFDPCYLHVGEGAGQGAGARPPLLLQSSAQHLKLPLLLPHGGQQGGRTRTLLHSHAESRAQDRTGQSQHQRARRGFTNTEISSKNRHKQDWKNPSRVEGRAQAQCTSMKPHGEEEVLIKFISGV